MGVGVQNAYWLTMFNVTNLPGNKFVNGMILGAGECISCYFAGFLISCTNVTRAFQILGFLGIGMNAINQFACEAGSILSYVALLGAMLGVGGIYATFYVLIAD